VLHADGYAGFNSLYESGRIVEVACWAHVRRKFFDVHAANGSEIAKQALDRIGALYGVEAAINGMSPVERYRQRQAQSKSIANALKDWTEEISPKLSGRSELAAAFRYMLTRWLALNRCLTTAASASTTIQPSGHCVASPLAERTISLPVPTAAANEPPPCTPLSKPQSSTVSIQRPTYAMSSTASPIIQSTASPSFCRGTGNQLIKSIEQPRQRPFAERLRCERDSKLEDGSFLN
jgi:hypothetical protein